MEKLSSHQEAQKYCWERLQIQLRKMAGEDDIEFKESAKRQKIEFDGDVKMDVDFAILDDTEDFMEDQV